MAYLWFSWPSLMRGYETIFQCENFRENFHGNFLRDFLLMGYLTIFLYVVRGYISMHWLLI